MIQLITNNKYITKWRKNIMTNNEFIAMNEIAKHYNSISNKILNKKKFFLHSVKLFLNGIAMKNQIIMRMNHHGQN